MCIRDSLTGVDIAPADVVDVVVQEWPDAVASPRTAAALAAAPVRIAGASVAGTGLASVIPHARALAATLIAELRTPIRPASDPLRSHA